MKRVYVIFGLALLAIAGMFALFINATITTRRMSDSYYGNKDSKYYSVQTTDLKCSYHLNQDDLSYSLKIVNPLIYFEKETNTYDCLHEMLPIKNDELVFPSHYDGLPITRIYVDDEKVPIYPNNLKRIVIPGTVEELGDYTFYRCKAQNIVLPNSITKMGREVFSDCFNLRYIELPSGLKSIPEAAFSNCYNLTEVIMKDGIKSIDNYAFSDCENLKQIDIPNGVTSIGYYVFDGCKRMKNISIPSSLNEINTNSFSESINYNIYNGGKYLGNDANLYEVFVGTENGTDELIISNSCHLIAPDTLLNSNVKSIRIPSSIKSLGEYVFKGAKFSAVYFEDGLNELKEGCFKDCKNLETIHLPQTLKSIGKKTFHGCTSLKEITLPSNLNLIDEGAFCGCYSLKNAKLNDGLIEIKSNAFEACRQLEEIEIPSTTTTLEDYAFKDCSKLKNVTLYDNLSMFNKTVFEGCSLVANSDSYGSYLGNSSNPYLYLYDLENTGEGADLVIPDGCKGIVGLSGYGERLNSVSMPQSLEWIGSKSLFFKQSVDVVIPEGVKYIGSYAFSDSAYINSKVSKITISSSVELIEDSAFYGIKEVHISKDYQGNMFAIGSEKIFFDGTVNEFKKSKLYNYKLDYHRTSKYITINCTDGIISIYWYVMD